MKHLIDLIYLSILTACILVTGVSNDINTTKNASAVGINVWLIYIGFKVNEKQS